MMRRGLPHRHREYVEGCFRCELSRAELVEQGRRLANERDDLIAQGVDPSDLLIPIHPDQQ